MVIGQNFQNRLQTFCSYVYRKNLDHIWENVSFPFKLSIKLSNHYFPYQPNNKRRRKFLISLSLCLSNYQLYRVKIDQLYHTSYLASHLKLIHCGGIFSSLHTLSCMALKGIKLYFILTSNWATSPIIVGPTPALTFQVSELALYLHHLGPPLPGSLSESHHFEAIPRAMAAISLSHSARRTRCFSCSSNQIFALYIHDTISFPYVHQADP